MNNRMMVYNLREFDEKPLFEKYAKQYNMEICSTTIGPSLENAELAKDCTFVNIITTPINRELLEKFYRLGVRCIVTRTIGYDHIDSKAAEEFGIAILNTPYGPSGVAEYALMLMLMCVKNAKSIAKRYEAQDYTLKGLIGGELSSMTVGILGTGRIGMRLAELLQGFGCRVIAYSPHPKENSLVEYVSLDTLLKESDVISLHALAAKETYHILGKEELSKTKKGVVIVNTARGSLLDTEAVLELLEEDHFGGIGLDVVEDESALFYYDLRGKAIHNPNLYRLQSYPNVIITQHMAFYTKQAVETMVGDSIKKAAAYRDGKEG